MKKPLRHQNDVDKLLHRTMQALIEDFRDGLSDATFCSNLHSSLRTGDIRSIREAVPTVDYATTDLYRFKAEYQMASINKRHRYQNDIFTEDELIKASINGFRETQLRLQALDFDNLDAKTRAVLSCAAVYIREVLGPYDDVEHRALCRFGRKASVGIPARLASLAQRWELPLTGSREQIAWFDSEMSQVDCVQEYWSKQLDSDPNRSVYQEVSSLKLTLVPKTFKSLRAIMPNTTIGSYMSYGLGEMIRKRLKKKGYDISNLQMRHRYLAQQGSVHKQYTTADLSSASDSISVALIDRLLPSDWKAILSASRIGEVCLPDDTMVTMETYCTMGIGYTFPLQTLVFLALLKSIEFVNFGVDNNRTISVYGDDLIYSPRMHPFVQDLFPKVGFLLNVDKTFNEGHFRESCGGDYHCGMDVRPFQPRSGSTIVSSKVYEAVIYRFINGLLMRWTEYEIARTLDLLTAELERVCGVCKIVPPSFPDDSGIKTTYPRVSPFLEHVRCAKPKSLGHGLFRFSYLRFKPEMRKETRHEPYLWHALGNGLESDVYHHDQRRLGLRSFYNQLFQLTIGLRQDERILVEMDDTPAMTVRSNLTGRRYRRRSTFLAINHTGSYTRQSGISCFETVDSHV